MSVSFFQCFDTVSWGTGSLRKSIWPVKNCATPKVLFDKSGGNQGGTC